LVQSYLKLSYSILEQISPLHHIRLISCSIIVTFLQKALKKELASLLATHRCLLQMFLPRNLWFLTLCLFILLQNQLQLFNYWVKHHLKYFLLHCMSFPLSSCSFSPFEKFKEYLLLTLKKIKLFVKQVNYSKQAKSAQGQSLNFINIIQTFLIKERLSTRTRLPAKRDGLLVMPMIIKG